MNPFAKNIVLLSVLFFLSPTLSAQYVQRSTLGFSGGVSTINSSGNSYLVSQSIGQASVIGTFSNNSYTIGQGFQQSPLKVVVIPQSNNKLNVIVYPNPVETNITIKLQEKIDSSVHISLFDVNGSVVYSDIKHDSEAFEVNMSLLTSGTYLLRLTMGERKFVARLLKQ